MCSIKNIYGKEYNTAKGVNVATEFGGFKDEKIIENVNEKIIRHKMKRIQSKKDSVTSCKEIEKDCDKKYSDKKDRNN